MVSCEESFKEETRGDCTEPIDLHSTNNVTVVIDEHDQVI